MEGLETMEDAALLGSSSDSDEDEERDAEGGMAASSDGEEEQGVPHSSATTGTASFNITVPHHCEVIILSRPSVMLDSGRLRRGGGISVRIREREVNVGPELLWSLVGLPYLQHPCVMWHGRDP